ncbi:hypothetical protein B0H13DRAFT_674566 [Mycena leptocephala]|nr:hypothetical protein B0H13DRAFT_674566 [Mycena leptocephala]
MALERHPPRHIRFLRPFSHATHHPCQYLMAATRTTIYQNAVRGVRAPAPTSSRGCSQTHSPRTHRRKGGGTTTPTPSRSTHTSPPGRRAPAHAPAYSLWGFNLLGNGRGRGVALEGGETSCTRRLPLALALMTHHEALGKKRHGSRSGTAPGASTDDLLARRRSSRAHAAQGFSTTDVSGARIRAPPHRISKGSGDRARAPRRRKAARRLAAALAELNTPEFERFPCSGSGKLPPQPTFRAPPYNGIPSPSMNGAAAVPPADALAHLAARRGRSRPRWLAYALLAPRGVGDRRARAGAVGGRGVARRIRW